MKEFRRGFGYAFAGLGMLRKPGLKRFVLLPLLVNIVVFSAAGYWAFNGLGRLTDWIEARLPNWLDWLTWLIWPLAILAFLVAIWLLFTIVANLIASPFNGILSERVAAHLGHGQTGPEIPLWREVVNAPVHEVRKLAWFALLAIPVVLLSLVPGVNAIASVLWLIYGAWILAAEYMDYPLGNRGMAFRDQRSLVGRRRGLALGFGAGVLLMTSVPVLNFAAMPAAVTGATILWLRELA